MFKTLEEAKSFCKDNGITMLDFKMTDINGAWRHITLPVDRLDEDMMIYGVGFDGSNYGYAQVENSDMVFIPDLSTAAVEPYTEGVLTMTGDVMIIAVPNNKPFDQYPRNVAKRAVEYMKETGIADTMIIGPEFEFHVFDEVSFRNDPHHSEMRIACDEAYWATSEGTNGHQIRYKAGYHADIPHDVNFELRNEMCRTLENWGVKVKYHHHEVGSPAQEEIETEMGVVSIPERVTSDLTVTVPVTGVTYPEVKFAWTSDNECAVVDAATGKIAFTLPAVDTTVTISLTVTCGAETKTVTYKVIVESASTDLYLPEKVETPAKDNAYKFFLNQVKLGKIFYFAGYMDGYYLATTEKADKAVDVYLEAVEGKENAYLQSRRSYQA